MASWSATTSSRPQPRRTPRPRPSAARRPSPGCTAASSVARVRGSLAGWAGAMGRRGRGVGIGAGWRDWRLAARWRGRGGGTAGRAEGGGGGGDCEGFHRVWGPGKVVRKGNQGHAESGPRKMRRGLALCGFFQWSMRSMSATSRGRVMVAEPPVKVGRRAPRSTLRTAAALARPLILTVSLGMGLPV